VSVAALDHLLLAIDGEPTEAPGVDDLRVEVDRPIADWLEGHTDSELIVWLVRNGLEPALQILLILTLALALLWFVRRTIRRAVARAKDPEAARGRRLREKVGMHDASKVQFSVRRAQRADALGALGTSIAGVVIWTLAVFMILGTVGITLGPLIAGAGIIGLALGFGAQGLVRDFISGIFMLVEDQYGVGDIVDVGEATGVVEGVTLRSTRIRDVEGTLWHVPNGEIARVGNMSQQWARVLLDVSVSYGTDVDHAIEIIEAVAVAMSEEADYRDLFIQAPEVWGVQTLGADAVDIRLVIKVKPAEQWALGRELRRRIKAAFDAADVEIPFPQRTVWLRTEQPIDLARRADDDGDRHGGSGPDPSAVRRAVESAAKGDRGRQLIEGQDVEVVAEVEEQAAADAGVPAEDDGRGPTSDASDRPS
jgi:moderate conductance mechanosensitive channel